MTEFIKKNWIKIVTLTIGLFFFMVIYGCEPKVESLFNDDYMVTGSELNIELEAIIAIAKSRHEDLERQIQLRNLILKNVLIVAESGTLNPVSVLTALFAFYGLGSATNSTKNLVKKKLTHND